MKKYSFNAGLFSEKLSEWIGDRTLSEAGRIAGVDASTLCRLTQKKKPEINTFARLCLVMGQKAETFFIDN